VTGPRHGHTGSREILHAARRQWLQAAAAGDGVDLQVFVRGLLAKLTAGMRGMARAEPRALTPGERQFCLLLEAKQLATLVGDPGTDEAADGRYYVIDTGIHERRLELLARPGLALRTMASPRASTTPAG
jgi:hypothetical protein